MDSQLEMTPLLVYILVSFFVLPSLKPLLLCKPHLSLSMMLLELLLVLLCRAQRGVGGGARRGRGAHGAGDCAGVRGGGGEGCGGSAAAVKGGACSERARE